MQIGAAAKGTYGANELVVDGLFRDTFDSSQILWNSPPAWIIRSAAYPISTGLSHATSAPPTAQTAGPTLNKGEKNQLSSRASRDPPHTLSPAPATHPAPAIPEIQVCTTKHPLSFAYSPTHKLSKSLPLQPPKYGSGADTKHVCFNFSTDGWCKCSGIPLGKSSKRLKPCYRLHVSLDPSGPYSSDPAEHFVDLVWFLQTDGVADYFILSDEFATLQQYKDALARL